MKVLLVVVLLALGGCVAKPVNCEWRLKPVNAPAVHDDNDADNPRQAPTL